MNKDKYPIYLMCEELEISRDSYYKWLKRKDSKNSYEIRRDSYKSLINKYYNLSNGTAGYRQIRDQIEEHEEVRLSDYMAYTIKCKDLQLPEIRKKKNKGKYTIEKNDGKQKKYTYDNLAESINISDINQVLSTDTTEIKLQEEARLGYTLNTIIHNIMEKYGSIELGKIEDEEDREIVQIIREINIRYGKNRTASLLNAREIEDWVEENGRKPRKQIKGIKTTQNIEEETEEQRELRLGKALYWIVKT